jgi:hypothetical protein
MNSNNKIRDFTWTNNKNKWVIISTSRVDKKKNNKLYKELKNSYN